MPLSTKTTRLARTTMVALTALAAIGGLFALGAAPKLARREQAREIATRESSLPRRVTVAEAELSSDRHTFVLPGSTVANQETQIYARAQGYLGEQRVDIGDAVTQGQLLAIIEAPEVLAELDAAKASVAQAEAERKRIHAELELSQIRLAREQRLFGNEATSQEILDDREAEYKVALAAQEMAVATIEAKRAQVERLQQQIAFQKIVAPFDGVITARRFDLGALITADSVDEPAGLFRISEIKQLRVIVDIPQQHATSLNVGDRVFVYRPHQRKEKIEASVSRTTRSISPDARTLRVEVQIPNHNERLLPGMYVEAQFTVQQLPRVLIPSGALITRGDGTKVAVLGDNDTVTYRPVTVLRDLGSSLELSEGLQGDETLIIRPGDDIAEGTRVRPVRFPKED